MDCELCANEYNQEESLPKLVKPCSHTYCQKCLYCLREKSGVVYCPSCQGQPTTDDPKEMATNTGLLKIIKYRRDEKEAFQLIKRYEIRNPKFFPRIEETVTRGSKPHEIFLSEVTHDELVYFEMVQNDYLDKRQLGAH